MQQKRADVSAEVLQEDWTLTPYGCCHCWRPHVTWNICLPSTRYMQWKHYQPHVVEVATYNIQYISKSHLYLERALLCMKISTRVKSLYPWNALHIYNFHFPHMTTVPLLNSGIYFTQWIIASFYARVSHSPTS